MKTFEAVLGRSLGTAYFGMTRAEVEKENGVPSHTENTPYGDLLAMYHHPCTAFAFSAASGLRLTFVELSAENVTLDGKPLPKDVRSLRILFEQKGLQFTTHRHEDEQVDVSTDKSVTFFYNRTGAVSNISLGPCIMEGKPVWPWPLN